MLTNEQIQEFYDKGFIHIKNAFSREAAATMESVVWDLLAKKHQVKKSDPATWPTHVFKLQTLKTHEAFQAIGSDVTINVINDFFGNGRWKKPKDWGQFLVTFPEADTWTVPADWHIDYGYSTPLKPLKGLMVFSFFGDVPAQGGGTAVVQGSHRLIAKFMKRSPWLSGAKQRQSRLTFMKSDPWLKNLSSEDAVPDRMAEFMAKSQIIDGIPLRVRELTGKAGDIVVGHPLLLHAKALNCNVWPRFMCIQRIQED
ncbi:MAG: hypothetical protein AAF629_09435 [Chloroflexota bacterium]